MFEVDGMTQIFDRGNKKWVSIMMLELRDRLRKVFADPPPERPELDEQEIERMNRLLMAAYQTGRPVRIRYWDDGEREVCSRITGFGMGQIRLSGEHGKLNIHVNDVLGVEF